MTSTNFPSSFASLSFVSVSHVSLISFYATLKRSNVMISKSTSTNQPIFINLTLEIQPNESKKAKNCKWEVNKVFLNCWTSRFPRSKPIVEFDWQNEDGKV